MSIEERLAHVESRLAVIEQQSAGTMDTPQAMHRLGYKSGKRFWQAVRRVGIPYSRLSKRNCVFRTTDIDAALARRQVGSGRTLRKAA